MTKQGGFKREARRRAREAGTKYTKVRSNMERVDIPTEADLRVEHDALRAHLEKRYGLSITSLAPFDGDHPLTFRVDHTGGAPWVARPFASAWRPAELVEGDAEILRFLEAQDYPAERLAHPQPVSTFDGQAVIVTQFVEGTRHVPKHGRLGDLLGRLHSLPLRPRAITRGGGAFGHDIVHEGHPAQDVAAAMNFLNAVEEKVAPEHRANFDALREAVAAAETCEGLPEALTHPNFGEYRVVLRPDDEIVVVAWSGAGRGARIATLAWQLWLTADAWHPTGMGHVRLRYPESVDAVVAGYAAHVRPTDEELSRLPGAMMMRSLYMACFYYERSIALGYQPSGGEGWWPNPAGADEIAKRAIAAFRGADVTRMPMNNKTTTAKTGAKTPAKEPAAEKKHPGRRVASEGYGAGAAPSRSTVLERYRRHADAFETLIAGTPPDRWEWPSPCEKWTARDVVDHVVGHTRSTLRERGGIKPNTATSVRKDTLAAFRATRADLERVLADPATPEATMHYLDAALCFDLPQHWWDLAKATGQNATMDAEFVQTAWDTLAPMPPDWWHWQRETIKAYGPPVAVPDNASLQDRLLGLLGRNPKWTANKGKKTAAARPLELVMSPVLEGIVRDVMHLEPRRIQPVRGHLHRVTTTDERVVYVKHGRTAETGGRFRLEAWAYEQCRAKGVLVPEVLAASDPGDEIDYLATVPLTGRALTQLATNGKPTVTGDALKPILRTAGEQLRAMHEIRVDGFGPIVGAPPRGAYAHWCPFIDMARDALLYLVEEGVLSRDESASLDAQFAEAESALQKDTPGRLLHGGLEGDHMFSHRGRFTGFLDFEGMQSGDPCFDLAVLAWWYPPMLPDVLDGYGRDALTDEDRDVRMPAYLVANAVVLAAHGKSASLPARDVKRQPIRHPQGHAQFIRVARRRANFSRPGLEGHEPAAAGVPGQSQLQMLIDNVNGKTDDQIAAFADGVGGFPVLCDMVFQGMKGQMKPQDCNVAFVLGDKMGWVFRASGGKNTIAKRVAKRAPAIVRASPADFLRMITRDLDWQAAVTDGRVTVEGDSAEVATLFAGSSQG